MSANRVPSVIKGDNDVLIEELAPLYFPRDAWTLDLTYGTGVFWKRYRPAELTTNDLDTDTNAGHHEDWRRRTTFPSGGFARVVFDPPYVSVGGRDTSTLEAKGSDMVARYAMHETEKNPWLHHVRTISPGIHEAARLCAPGGFVFVKAQSYVTGGRVQRGTVWVENSGVDAGLVWWDEVIHHTGLKAQPLTNPNGSKREQQHVHGAHSVLIVFKKPALPKPRTKKGQP